MIRNATGCALEYAANSDTRHNARFNVSMGKVFSALVTMLVSLSFATAISAQEAPFNIGLVGTFDQANNYADIWGDGNYAYLARFGVNEINIVDISNPASPQLAATYDTGVGGASAQDVKVHNDLMFVSLEGVSPGAQIVDVRNPVAPVKLTDITVRTAVHNTFYYEGWLYLVDSQLNEVDIVDLRNYDPDSAPSVIATSTYEMVNVGNQFVHDITVQDDRLYVSAWDSIRIFDVSNLDSGPPVFMGSAQGNAVHAAWPTGDNRFLVVSEERASGGLTLYELDDNGTTVTLTLRDALTLDSSRAFSTHNPVVVGNTVYASWYEAGLQVLEIDPVSATWDVVASYDTSLLTGANGFFDGNWGVYPFLGTDRVLASDVQNGLFVLDVDPNLLRFDFPGGLPTTVTPQSPTVLQLVISEIGSPLDPATATLQLAIDGVSQSPVALNSLGGGVFEAVLPAATCGSVITYSVTAQNAQGDTFTEPSTGSYTTTAVSQVVNTFSDTFASDAGWSTVATDLTTGEWVLGTPIGTGAQPGGGWPGDADNQCYFTGQGTPGGGIGEADVDGGPAILTSPAMDYSQGDGPVSYVYWFSNDDGDDSLVVELSSEGGAWVEAARYSGGVGNWIEDSVNVGDFVTPSADVRVRFVVSDNPNDSVTEAAIDSIRGDVFLCDVITDTDGDGVGDDTDNCTNVANPDQRDTNGDGFGNVCDADLNNDGVINFIDVSQFSAVFLGNDADADFNGDGAVNFVDFVLVSQSFLGAPGPSGVAP
ncbi:MAG: thrombospondin type 3 repeat-containing protein [Pseudomonadota bacterium]